MGLLSVSLFAHKFSQPHVLMGIHQFGSYNEGVYFGSALRLVDGYFPYRDFTLLHPPGLTLILAPVAALSQVVGEQSALAIARLLSAGAAVAVVVLGTLVVRFRGRVAMLTAGVVLACSPRTSDVATTVELEPYYVFLCMLGAFALFGSTGDLTVSRRRTFAGGLAFGLACTVKVWAFAPAIAVLGVYAMSCLARKQWWRARLLLGGIAAGIVVPILPFFALAPKTFVHDVIAVQLARDPKGWNELSIGARFPWMTGLAAPPELNVPSVVAVGLVLALVVAAVVSYATVGGRVPVDWFVLTAAIATVTGACVPRQFFGTSYGYLPGVFLALLLGVVVGRLTRAVPPGLLDERVDVRLLRYMAMAGFLFITYIGSLTQASYSRHFISHYVDFGKELASYIQPDACVVSDGTATPLIVADRLTGRRCPATIDVFGQWLSADPAHPPSSEGPFNQKLVSTWETSMRQADYLILASPHTTFVPWTPQLDSYFRSNYTLLYTAPHAFLFRRTTELDPGRLPSGAADRLVWTGIAAQQAGNTKDAMTEYEGAARIDPRNKFAHFNMGTIHQQNGATTSAEREYAQALTIDPRFGGALYNMGVLLSERKRAKAISYFLRYLKIDPDHAAANHNLGKLLISRGDVHRGRAFLRRAIRSNPTLQHSEPSR
ncbi:tetratricopeptide repeat protein [Nonomuraea sp. NPDC049152]|uniref:tetratricopeptide repeat protein n=1 Tax=Nonomuraea sp. NPDC049152 TaxID=3154350 RepID=UPI0034042F94